MGMIERLGGGGALGQRLLARLAAPGWPLACAGLVFVVLIADLIGLSRHGGLFAEDDAYYYLVIARHIAQTGVSTFDGQSLSNGYHPLWMVVLVLQDLILGESFFITFTIEALLIGGALALILRRAPVVRADTSIAFTILSLFLLTPLVMRGMEISLVVFCIALLVEALEAAKTHKHGGVLLGLACAAVVGARIDAAFFIAPILLFAPLPRRTRLTALAVMAGLGAVYGLANLLIFGALTPISSGIKSLGGLQINHPLLLQLSQVLHGAATGQLYFVTLAGLAGSPVLIWRSRPGTVARTLAIGATIGGAVYVAKLLFASSWVIWNWYNFPLMFPLIAGFYVGVDLLERWRLAIGWNRLAERVAGGLGVVVLSAQAVTGVMGPFRVDVGYAALNTRAVARFAPILAGQRIAMGDRAGAFAMAYPGPVVQLEGLVNDKAYFAAIKRRDDVTQLLCDRGVRFVVDYEVDLPGDYGTHRIEVFRTVLTQARGPRLVVHGRDEIGRVADTAHLNTQHLGDEADNTLYLWRLRCPAAR